MLPELRHLALSGALSPDDAFDTLFGDSPHAFWLDTSEGRVLLGDGDPEEASVVDDVRIASEAQSTPVGGGWVGWFGYDAGAIAAGAPGLGDAAAPEGLLIRMRRLVIIDPASREVLIAAGPLELADLRVQVDRLLNSAAADSADPGPQTETLVATSRHSPAEYAQLIAACRARIRDGDAYQLCLTTRFTVVGDVDARRAHRRLRAGGRAPHGGLVRSPEATLVSASPESFLSVGGGVIRTRPIKGTRPRGGDPESDAALARELAASVKEQAENIMIVDLMRNDLQIVCEPGTVTAERLLEVEPHPRVHQLVSTVAGKLRRGTRVGDVTRACFPAGSMTGAPKLSAMTILRELEGGPRGVYAGCFGWIGRDGAMELGMVIRSIVVHPGGAYVGAGGGITWLSDADAEVAEVAVKAAAPLAALGATLPPDW